MLSLYIMVEALFPIGDADIFLASTSQYHSIIFSEEFHEKYFIFKTTDETSLELRISEEGNQLLGIMRREGATEIITYPLERNIGNLKEILVNTVGLDGELNVRQTVYEAGETIFSICKVEGKGFFVRLESYSIENLKEQASALKLDFNTALQQSLVSLAD